MTTTPTDIDLDEDQGNALPTAGSADTDLLIDGDIVNEDADSLDRLPDRAIQNSDRSVTLPLLYPVTIRSKKDGTIREKHYSSLTFHRLTGKDQRAIGATSQEKMPIVALACSTRLTQVLMDAIYDKMDGADIQDAGRVLNSFLTSGRTTGR